MQSRHTKRLLSAGLGAVVLAALWFYLAPAALGGSADYVVTEGVSMQPRFHAGDLAVVRREDSYRVGQIVAYHSNAFHTIVLHRIIAREGGRYIFKGDNNNFVDFEHPASSQLIGALWLHVPGVGSDLQSLRSPLLTGALMALGVALLAGGAVFARGRRRRRRERRAGTPGERSVRSLPQPMAGPTGTVLAVGLLVLIPFLALALLAFTQPTTALLPAKLPYKQRGTFSYGAQATPGPAYAGDRASTGDPLFTHVVNAVDLGFDYRFHSAEPHSLSGRATLSASLASTSGWHKSLALAAPVGFHGDEAHIAARLDLLALAGLLHRVQAATQVNGSYKLTLNARVDGHGMLGVAPLQVAYTPQLQFTLNPLELQPVSTGGSLLASTTMPSEPPFVQAQTSSLAGRREQPRQLSLKFVRMSVATARTVSLCAIALIIAALLLALASTRPRRAGETAAIKARYGRLIVPVARVGLLPGVAVIDVADMESLARIAEHYDRSILHERSGNVDSFWVTDESGQFRYQARPDLAAEAVAAAAVPAEAAAPAMAPRSADGGEPITLVHPAAHGQAPIDPQPAAAEPVAAAVAEPVAPAFAAPSPGDIEEGYFSAHDARAQAQESREWCAAYAASEARRLRPSPV
jgi:signal peptidase I